MDFPYFQPLALVSLHSCFEIINPNLTMGTRRTAISQFFPIGDQAGAVLSLVCLEMNLVFISFKVASRRWDIHHIDPRRSIFIGNKGNLFSIWEYWRALGCLLAKICLGLPIGPDSTLKSCRKIGIASGIADKCHLIPWRGNSWHELISPHISKSLPQFPLKEA